MCTLSKLAHGLPHTVMADMVVRGNSARWGAGRGNIVSHLGATLVSLTNVNSLNLWLRHFPSFTESTRRKHCSCWEQNTGNDGSVVPDAENMFENENSFNTRGSMDVAVHEIIRWGSRPDGEGPD